MATTAASGGTGRTPRPAAAPGRRDTAGRDALTGRALEAFVVWARVLDSHRTFPFGELQLTRAQLQALFQVAHAQAPVTPGALAEALGVTRGAVTQLVARLVELGLVEQARDAADARRRVLALPPASRARVEGFEAGLIRQLAPRFARLSDTELATLAELLSRTTVQEAGRPPWRAQTASGTS